MYFSERKFHVGKERAGMPEQGIARYKYIFDEILRMTDDGFIQLWTETAS